MLCILLYLYSFIHSFIKYYHPYVSNTDLVLENDTWKFYSSYLRRVQSAYVRHSKKWVDYNVTKATSATRTQHRKRFNTCQAGPFLDGAGDEDGWKSGPHPAHNTTVLSSSYDSAILARLAKLYATKRKAKSTTPELFFRIIICQISTIWDLGPVRIHKCSSDGRTPGQIFRIGVLILNHYHWQAAAFFFLLNPELKFNFLNFMKRNEKYPGGKRVAPERFWTSKTLKNLLMI